MIFLLLVLILIFKFFIVALGFVLFGEFGIRSDILLMIFYLAPSIVQIIFYIYQVVKMDSEKFHHSYRYAGILFLFMEYLIYFGIGFVLFIRGISLISINYIFSLLSMLGLLWYLFQKIYFLPSIIKKNKVIRVKNLSVIPNLFLYSVLFLLPIQYIVYKYFIAQKDLNYKDVLFVIVALGNDFVYFFISILYQYHNIKKITKKIMNTNVLDLESIKIPMIDENEMGYLASSLLDMIYRIKKIKQDLFLYNNYISKDMINMIRENGYEVESKTIIATVLTINYQIKILNMEMIEPEMLFNIHNQIFQIAGEYCDDYDAYPQFEPGMIRLIFGYPFDYEHKNYHALEAGIKISSDIDRHFEDQEEIAIDLNSAVYCGSIVAGALRFYGRDYPACALIGQAIEYSTKIAEAGKKLNVRLLTTPDVIKGMETKFHIIKNYKLVIQNTEILISQIKV